MSNKYTIRQEVINGLQVSFPWVISTAATPTFSAITVNNDLNVSGQIFGDGSQLDSLGSNSTISGHTADTSIHYVKSSINLSDLGTTGHVHTISEVNNLQTELNDKTSQTNFTTHTADTSIHSSLSGGTNLGNGAEIFSGLQNNTLEFRTLSATSENKITSSVSGNTVVLDVEEPNLTLWPLVVSGNQLISGGANLLSGLTFNLSALEYIIGSTIYTAPASTVTIESGGTTHDRIDVIFADISGNTGYIKGVESSNPSKPSLDVATQVEITFVTIPAGASTPDIDITKIYDEKLGTGGGEWDYSANTSLRISGDSTNDSFSGDKSIEFINAVNGDEFTMSNSSPYDTSDDNIISFYIKNNVNWKTNKEFIEISFRDSGDTLNGSIVRFEDGKFGFDSTNTSDWQVISISLGTFNMTSNLVSKVRFKINKNSGPAGNLDLYIDLIRFQAGAPTTSPQNIWLSFLADDTNVAVATSSTDQLRLSGGSNINTAISNKIAIFNLDDDISLSSVSATTISGDTFYGDGSNLTGLVTSDNYTTGTTLVNTTLYFDRNDTLSAYTADLSSFLDDTNFYVTGGTVIDSNMYLDRNDTLSAVTIDVSTLLDNTDLYITGGTHDGIQTVTLTRNDNNTFNISNIGSYTLFTSHTGNTSNPHDVTASQVGAPTTTLFNSHTGDTTIHYTKSSILLSELGSSAHTHSISEIDNLQSTLDSKALQTDFVTHSGNTSNPHSVTASQVGAPTTSQFNTHTGDTSTHYTKSSINLSELGSTAHTHSISEVNNLQSTLDNKALQSDLNTHTGDTSIHYTKSSINLSELGSTAHSHTISEVDNLQTTLDSKTNEGFQTFSSTTTGESFVSASTVNDTLTYSGVNVDILTDNTNKRITFSASTLAGTSTDAFKTISVDGQSDVVADSSTDTLTLSGININIITDSGNDKITFSASTDSGGGTSSRTSNSIETTTSGTTTIGQIDTLTNNSTHFIDFYLSAKSTGTSEWGVWKRSIVVTTSGSTPTIQHENADVDKTSENLSSTSLDFVVSGSNININVIGVDSTEIQWDSAHEIIVKSTKV